MLGEDLRSQDLRGRDFKKSDMRFVRLDRADLRGVDLSEADLSDADLYGADLRGANLTGAILSRARMRAAQISGARFRGAVLPDPTAMISANWGRLSPRVASIALRFEYHCHPNPEIAFTHWLEGSGPIYVDSGGDGLMPAYERAVFFDVRREDWTGNLALVSPAVLLLCMLRDACVDSPWHTPDRPTSYLRAKRKISEKDPWEKKPK